MANKSRRKGFGYERELVHQFQKLDMQAKRAWGSNGKTLGHDEEIDLLVHLPTGEFDQSSTEPNNEEVKEFKLQAKRIKRLPQWLGMSDKVDAVVFRADNDESYILMPLKTFIGLI